MFRLKLPTDPRWANIAEDNLEEILTDHAWCEQKAATNAITIITLNPELTDLVADMLALAKEELEHFERVHEIIRKRGLDAERRITELYLQQVADRYTRYFYQYDAAPLFIVDAGQLNPVDRDEDFELLLERLRDMRSYREFFGYAG